MINRYFVIDDFYNDPDRLVEEALKAQRDASSRGNYAGVMTKESFLSNSQREFFEQLLQQKPINSSTELNGKIRFSKANDPFTQHIHFDAGRTHWSGVVYLSKEHPKVDGTVFWKHLPTGLEEIPRTLEGAHAAGFTTKEKVKEFLEVDGINESLWEKTFAIPYKYNRLVLFRPWMFHSPGVNFGDTLENSRKVQTLFLGP